jgi:hypothetical protein
MIENQIVEAEKGAVDKIEICKRRIFRICGMIIEDEVVINFDSNEITLWGKPFAKIIYWKNGTLYFKFENDFYNLRQKEIFGEIINV